MKKVLTILITLSLFACNKFEEESFMKEGFVSYSVEVLSPEVVPEIERILKMNIPDVEFEHPEEHKLTVLFPEEQEENFIRISEKWINVKVYKNENNT